MRKLFILILCLTFLSGCMGIVRTTTTTFHGKGHEQRGSIFVAAADAQVNGSLEFSHYKQLVEEKLITIGYTLSPTAEKADFIALVAYGIDNGKTSIVSTPIFGQTGGGTTYSSGSVYGYGGSASYSGTSYTMPTYGIVGSSTSSQTEYTRAIALDIVDAKSIESGKPEKLYEMRARSTGSCSSINGVFDEILEAMFKSFPGDSGKSQTIEVPWDGSC
ncbi:DUF4136 domain-containing protein [Sedimenticola selenatireducens]|uniref:DUF4136 domain-containing protein n=1 Tax=Sedimenticola selenatireducens TaxID=191960 RepID=A0A2N6CXV6_9GAMM|nr:DUF4136 domain-containing protein [Sedimenticola selenatireducens]PLX62146.1 MAG: hypothetical protein C0630_06960 [Sedimenticola selenatireducens]